MKDWVWSHSVKFRSRGILRRIEHHGTTTGEVIETPMSVFANIVPAKDLLRPLED